MNSDTIVALSSSVDSSRVSNFISEKMATQSSPLVRAIVRLSGSRAIEFASTVFVPTQKSERLSCVKSWRRIAGKLTWVCLTRSYTFDATAYVMKSPRSYTREDVVELHFPALRGLLSNLLDALLRGGARLAQPGEFTRRAYENGRINLDQAKNIAALIQAVTADEARAFSARTQQRVSIHQRSLRTEIEELLALVELGLDFSAEDVEVISLIEMRRRLDLLHQKSLALLPSNQTPELTGERFLPNYKILTSILPRIVLVGPTNAGKSTLFNALLERETALVSATRHTTRDCVEALFHLNHSPDPKQSALLQALLIDTAGFGTDIENTPVSEINIDTSTDRHWLRQAAWQKTQAAIRTADILLIVQESTVSEGSIRPNHPSAELSAIWQALHCTKPAATFLIKTKADLSTSALSKAAIHDPDLPTTLPLKVTNVFELSAHSGQGLNELRFCLYQTLHELSARVQAAKLASESAARLSADQCTHALSRAAEALQLQHGEDAVAVELREALQACWQAEGLHIRHDAITEGLLDRIFSQFCIGK